MRRTEHLQHLILRQVPQVQIVAAFTRGSGGGESLLLWQVNVILVEPPDHLVVIVEKLSEREDRGSHHARKGSAYR